MASRISPYVDNTGLVFAYDLANVQRSYLGEPTVNYVPDTYGYGAYAYVSGPVDTSTVNEKGDSTTVKRYTITQAVNTARAAIFPSGLTAGVAYTFSFKWKYNGSTTASPSISISAAKGNPEGGANNNSFTSQEGATTGIGNGWYLSTYIFMFSSVPTSACILTFGISTGSTAGFVGETFDIYEAQFEIKNHKTQYSNGTRSVTQGLKDLTGNSTIDLTNVSFDSNAQMTFDGTNDKIQGISTVHSHLSSSAIEFVVTPTAVNKKMTVGGYRHNEGYSSPTIGMVYIDSDNKFYASVITAAEVYRFVVSTTTVQANKTYHVVFNKDTSAGVMQLYVNGVAEGAQTFNVATYAQWSSAGSYIGSDILDFGKSNNTNSGQGWSGDFLQGELEIFKLYGRTLSASEIQQNFNAIKGRYGL